MYRDMVGLSYKENKRLISMKDTERERTKEIRNKGRH